MSSVAPKKRVYRRRRNGRSKPKVYYKGKGAYSRRRYRRRSDKILEVVPMDQTTGIMQQQPTIIDEARNIGGSVGALLGHGIKWFIGKGDYKVKENILLEHGSGNMPPIINKNDGTGFTVRRCEYITDVISSSSANTFKLNSYEINPGLETTFMWLSQVAANFDEWVCEGMYFEFRSMSADALNSTNTALGSVIMAAQYNSVANDFTSKQAMENYEGGVSCRPSQSMRYFVECARNQTVLSELYVRSGSVPSGQDQRFYDLANFQIATTGMQGTNVNVGELWVCYQITLRKPKLYVALGEYDSFYYAQPLTGASSSAPLGTSRTVNSNSNISMIFNDPTGTIMTFPFNPLPQSYWVSIWYLGTAAAITTYTIVAGTGLTVTTRSIVPANAVSSTQYTVSFTVHVPANNLQTNNTINLSGGGPSLPTSISDSYLFIKQIPNSFLGF